MRSIMRVFRLLAGVQEGKPWSRWHVALYGILALSAMVLAITWLGGASVSCVASGVCGR